jgi:hypothetical protein
MESDPVGKDMAQGVGTGARGGGAGPADQGRGPGARPPESNPGVSIGGNIRVKLDVPPERIRARINWDPSPEAGTIRPR